MPLESRILQNSHYIQEILIRVLENPQKTLSHHDSRLLLILVFLHIQSIINIML